MKDIAPNTPVIVGVGFYQNHAEDPTACPEPFEMMAEAIRDAASDAGKATLTREIESISVEQGMWQYRNPGRLIAEAIGCPDARSVLADLGVLQLTPLFDLFDAIQAGEISLGVVTGGEAKYRDLRSKITGVEVHNREEQDDTPPPDVYHPTPDPFATQAESNAGIMMPVELFAVIESALRAHQGLGVEEHRDQVAELYSEFSQIASQNPHAWSREPVSAETIRNPAGKNTLLAFPYTKKHNSQWNVNQAVAILVCSYARAQALGLDESRWIYPVSAAQSRHVVCLAEQKTLHSHPGTVVAGERAYQLANIKPSDIAAADLYSCFPSAVQSFALDLKLGRDIPWTVTGSMAFAGGPYNHGALDGVARMAEVLREKSAEETAPYYGLTSNLSGIFGKQAVAVFSNAPGENGYRYADVTAEVAAIDHPVPSITDYEGPAQVLGYTVVFHKETITHGIVYGETPAGERVVARSDNQSELLAMTEQEWVGKSVTVSEGKFFSTQAADAAVNQ